MNKTPSKKEKLDSAVKQAAIILVIGALAPLLDSTMMNVAIKTLTVDLNTTVSVIQWVITGYVLTMGVAVPISGWASNRFGGKQVYMLSLVLFLGGSILSSLSWDIGSLIAFRLIQGLGAGLMFPTLQTLLVEISGGQHLGQLMSYVSIPAVLGPILGPVLGGVIVNSLGWRWVFYVNIPVTIIALLLAWRGLPEDRKADHQKQSLDWIGLSMLSPAFAILIYGIAQTSSHGGFSSSAVYLPVLIGLILMVAFVIYALKVKGRPVLDVRLFSSRNFSAACVLLFLSGIISNGAMLLLPLYYQQVQGASVLNAGLLLIPQGVGMLLTRSWFGTLTDRIGSRVIVLASLGMIVVGTLPFAFADAGTSEIILAVALLIRGAGLGGLLIPIMASAYVGLEKKQIPDASTATRILQTIGGAFGSAILATVIQQQLTGASASSIQNVASAFNTAFGWSIGFTIISLLPALLLTRQETKQRVEVAVSQEAVSS